MIPFVGSSGTICYLVVGHFQCMAITFHYNPKLQSIGTVLCNLLLHCNQNMSNVVSEWLIYSKSSSVPNMDIMTNLNSHRLRHFSSYEKCVLWGWEWAVGVGAVNHCVNLFTYRLIHCHLLWIYMNCCELSAHPGRDVLWILIIWNLWIY